MTPNKKIQVLENRRERLIELNRLNGYSQSGNTKTAKYSELLREISMQKGEQLRLAKIEHEKTDRHKMLIATKGRNGSQVLRMAIFKATNPGR